jgi:hypothetical protein
MCWRRLSGFALQSHEELSVTRDVQCRNTTLLCWQTDMDSVKRWSIKGVEVV